MQLLIVLQRLTFPDNPKLECHINKTKERLSQKRDKNQSLMRVLLTKLTMIQRYLYYITIMIKKVKQREMKGISRLKMKTSTLKILSRVLNNSSKEITIRFK